MPKFAPTGAVDVEPLELPIGDKLYRIAPPDAATGLLVSQIGMVLLEVADGRTIDGGDPKVKAILSDQEEADLMDRLLGDALVQMKADRVPYPYLQLVLMTALAWVLYGDAAAEKVWAGGVAPKAPKDHKAGKRTTRKAPPA